MDENIERAILVLAGLDRLKTVLPGESIKKVEICSSSYQKSLHAVVALNQLEEKYGGTCKDREHPQDFYPMYFPPGPFDPEAPSLRMPASPRGGASSDIRTTLHDFTPVTLHEGGLWIEGQEEKWLPSARLAPLTKEASNYLKQKSFLINPCETYDDLLNLLHQSQEDVTDTHSEDSKKHIKSTENEVVSDAAGTGSKVKDASDRPSLRAAATNESGLNSGTEPKRDSKRLSVGEVPKISAPMAEQLSRERNKTSRERKSKTSLTETMYNPLTGGMETVEVEQPEHPLPILPSRSRDRDLGDNKDSYGTCGWCSCRPCGR